MIAQATSGVLAPEADTSNPDAELIRVCAQHCVNMDAYNSTEAEDRRLWLAYSKTRDFISEAKPQTLAGVLAKCRAARHEAVGRNGRGNWGGTMGEVWAPDIVNDMLRVTGGAER